MRNKVIALGFGGFLLLAAASPAPPPTDTLDDALKFCELGLKAFRSGEAGQKLVQQQFAKMDTKTASAVAVVCRAYTAGYDTGRRDALQNTT